MIQDELSKLQRGNKRWYKLKLKIDDIPTGVSLNDDIRKLILQSLKDGETPSLFVKNAIIELADKRKRWL